MLHFSQHPLLRHMASSIKASSGANQMHLAALYLIMRNGCSSFWWTLLVVRVRQFRLLHAIICKTVAVLWPIRLVLYWKNA